VTTVCRESRSQSAAAAYWRRQERRVTAGQTSSGWVSVPKHARQQCLRTNQLQV